MKSIFLWVAILSCLGCSSASVNASPDPAGKLTIVTTNISPAQLGVSYKVQLVAVGGKTPYKWLIISGKLPNGLTLDSTGFIQGVPQQQGQFNFTVEVESSTGAAAVEIKSTN